MSIRLIFSLLILLALTACGGGGGGGGSTTTPASSTPAASSVAPSSSSSSSSLAASSSSASSVSVSSSSSSALSSISSSVAALSFCVDLSTPDNGDGSGTESGSACRVRTGFDITADMGYGWNLGNTMDATGCKSSSTADETCWGNPTTTQANLDALDSKGFKTFRLPISWDDHTGAAPDFVIDSVWMDRVEAIANYALNKNMYVIVNIHHNDGWENPTTTNETIAKARLTKLWTQIATRFKNYDHHVIFETMNEPRAQASVYNKTTGKYDDDWYGNDDTYFQVLNRMNQTALDAIRATGGKNARRLVMIPGYAAAVDPHQLDPIVMPNDKMIALSAHAYAPYHFALDLVVSTSITTFGPTEQADLDTIFNNLNTKFLLKGIPVVFGEWGSLDKNNLSERVKHFTYFTHKGYTLKIPVVYWDNNAVGGTGENFGLLKRSDNTWYFPSLVQAIQEGWAP